MKVPIIIPACNEESRIAVLLAQLQPRQGAVRWLAWAWIHHWPTDERM